MAHGAPPLLDDASWLAELHAWGQALPKPTSILMLSAHWVEAPTTIGATTQVPLVYDFYGFPDRYYRVKYASPGAPDLAMRVRGLLGAPGPGGGPVQDLPDRGLDHGAFVPLIGMYPDADIPVLQISLPTLEPKALFEVGKRLAPLRDEGVLIVGSGFLTHNLRYAFSVAPDAPPPAWSKEFDHWVAEALSAHQTDRLLDYRAKAPGVEMALPSHEHFVPLIVAQGAALAEPVSYPITGYWFGGMTRRSVQFG